mgnify:FL=1|jgi:chloramphenicol-sensitive protein RarD
MNKGLVYVLSAYIFWGLHPIYWKMLSDVPALMIVANRIIWSLLFFMIIIIKRNELKNLLKKVKLAKITHYLIPSILIGLNWFGYVWAINNNFIIETSLGYYLSPFASVLLGVFILKEKLSLYKWFSILLALFGVLIMIIYYGKIPYVALYLALTWSVYGYLRKESQFNSLEGLTVETGLLSFPSLLIILFFSTSPTANSLSSQDITLLILSGLISGLPLLVFISGSRLINLSIIGIMQFLYSTMIFLLGYFVYNEPLSKAKLIGFLFIWSGLIIFSIEKYIKIIINTVFLSKQNG